MPVRAAVRRLLTSAFRPAAAPESRRLSPLGAALEQLEDRATPAVTTSFADGLLTVTLGASGDTATVTGTAAAGTSISVSGTGYSGEAFSNVSAINVGGTGTGQSVLVTTSGGSVAVPGDLTVAVGGSAQLGASSADAITAARVAVTATGAVAVNGVVTATATVAVPPTAGPPPGLPGGGFPLPSFAVQSATTGNGFVTFGAGSRVNADAQSFRAGTGAFGALAQVEVANGSFRDRAGAAAPAAFWYAQDSTIADAAIPDVSQFGGAVPAYYALNSTDAFLFVSSAAKVAGSHLTLASAGGTLVSAPLAVDSLRASSISTTLQGGTVTTTGAAGQVYAGAVTLAADATLSAGAGPVTFANSVSGGHALAVNSSGATTFGGPVGGTPLASLTTDAGGTTAINGGAVATTGAQTLNDPVALGAAATVLTAATVSFTDDLTLGGSAAAATSVLQVSGALTLGSGTTLTTTFAGPAAFGRVAVTGGAAYGGATLAVNYAGGFVPDPGAVFPVVTGGTAGTGQFANAAPPVATLAGDAYGVTYAGGRHRARLRPQAGRPAGVHRRHRGGVHRPDRRRVHGGSDRDPGSGPDRVGGPAARSDVRGQRGRHGDLRGHPDGGGHVRGDGRGEQRRDPGRDPGRHPRRAPGRQVRHEGELDREAVAWVGPGDARDQVLGRDRVRVGHDRERGRVDRGPGAGGRGRPGARGLRVRAHPGGVQGVRGGRAVGHGDGAHVRGPDPGEAGGAGVGGGPGRDHADAPGQRDRDGERDGRGRRGADGDVQHRPGFVPVDRQRPRGHPHRPRVTRAGAAPLDAWESLGSVTRRGRLCAWWRAVRGRPVPTRPRAGVRRLPRPGPGR